MPNRSIMKNLISLLIISCFALNLKGQNFYYGIKNGLITNALFDQQTEKIFPEKSYSFGLIAEYSPYKAIFSFSSEIQYLFVLKTLLFPMLINLGPGERVQYRILGGVVPLIRIKPSDADRTLGVGAKSGLGINFKINQKIILAFDIGFNYIPFRTYHYMHYGPTVIDRNIDRLINLNIGIKYSFIKNEPAHNK